MENTNSTFAADGLPVLIGSLPLTDHRVALDWILSATPEIPLWPQLPTNPLEQMMPQFAEGIPCIREEQIERTDGRILFDIGRPGFEEEMLAFFEEYMLVLEDLEKLDNSRFRVSRNRAEGLYLFAETIAAGGGQNDLVALKGQVTGPFTMLTGIKDDEGRAGYFNDTVRDMVIKAIAMKAAWQTRFLASKNGRQVIMFIDEPALAGLGSSAFISVTTAEIEEMINEVADAIHQVGGLAGIHVCANTDWELLLESKIDVLSFDAYSFFHKIAPLKDKIKAYLDRGSILAWGGIPTGEPDDIKRESSTSLTALWEQQADQLVGQSLDKKQLLRHSFITPSCGTGSLQPELAKKVLEMTGEVSKNLRAKHLS